MNYQKFSPFSIIKNTLPRLYKRYQKIWGYRLLKKLLDLANKKSKLLVVMVNELAMLIKKLALLSEKVGFEDRIHGWLVKRLLDLGKLVVDIGRVNGLGRRSV